MTSGSRGPEIRTCRFEAGDFASVVGHINVALRRGFANLYQPETKGKASPGPSAVEKPVAPVIALANWVTALAS